MSNRGASTADDNFAGISTIEGSTPHFVVGIGASAEDLEALKRFLHALLVNTGMAFVVVPHLSSSFAGLPDELLARFTNIPIVQVVEPVTLRSNHIYVLPPRAAWLLSNGRLHPADEATQQPSSSPMHGFFRSLKRDMGERSIAIVLSGSEGRPDFGDVPDEVDGRATKVDSVHRMYQLIFDSAPDGILTVDSEGIIRMVNARAVHMFGYSAQELVGNNIDLLVPAATRGLHGQFRNAFFDNPDTRRMGQTRWLEGQRKDGTTITVQVTLTPLVVQNSTHAMAFITDMTRTRALEAERDQITHKMMESQKLESLGVLAGGIAHDFNNLLTGIMATAGMLVDGSNQAEDLRESARTILESTHRAAELCQQLLAYSGRSKFVLRAQNVNELIEATSKLAQTWSIRKNAHLSFDLATNLPPVMLDEMQIRQAVMNLVINASEAVQPHAGVISVRTGRVSVTSEMLEAAISAENLREGGYVFIEVADNGCGVKPDELRRIFEPFYTTKFTGRGLGLSAVLGIVRGHRGALTVTSEIGQGTTFRLLLPSAPESKSVEPPEPIRAKMPWMGQGKVLVADDEPAIRNACRRLLLRMGFEVDVANDGRDALERFKEDPKKYALVLLDLTMPGTGGAEAFAEMKRIHPESRVILMSGFSRDDVDERMRNGVMPDAFLPKPFDHAALITALQQALEQSN